MFIMRDDVNGIRRRLKGERRRVSRELFDKLTVKGWRELFGKAYCREIDEACWRSLLSRDGEYLLEEPTVEGWRELVGGAYCRGMERTCWRSLLSRDGKNLLVEPTVEGWRELAGRAYCRGMESTCWRGHLVEEKSVNLELEFIVD